MTGAIANGPNPVTNALDMVLLTTLSSMLVDDTWVGERAVALQDAHRRLEPVVSQFIQWFCLTDRSLRTSWTPATPLATTDA